MKQTLLYTFLIWLMSMTHVWGQDGVLQSYITQGIANHQSLQKIELQKRQQENKTLQAKKRWAPNIDLNSDYLWATGGRTLNFPLGDLLNPVYGTLNQLTQSQSFQTDLENIQTQLTPNNYIDANIAISKPLINSAIKYNVLIQEALLKLPDYDRAQQEALLKSQIKLAYFNYLKTKQGQSILDENINSLNDVLAFNKKLVSYDKATSDILTDVEYQITNLQNQKAQVQQQGRTSQVVLNTILGRAITREILVDSIYMNEWQPLTSQLEDLIQEASLQRAEFQKINVSNEIIDLNVDRIKKSNQPTLGAQGAVGLQMPDFSFDEGGPLYTVGLGLDWKILDGGLRKAQIQEQQILKEQNALDQALLEDQVQINVASAYYKIQSLQTQLEDQEAALASAKESYNSVWRKYQHEKALLIEVLNAQNKITNSQLSKAVIILDLYIAHSELERILQR